MEREAWVQRDENAKLRERIAVLETNMSVIQAALKNLGDGQSANRAYSEKSLTEIKVELGEMRMELNDLKAVVTAKSAPSDEQRKVYQAVVNMGIGVGILIVVFLGLLVLVWLHPWVQV